MSLSVFNGLLYGGDMAPDVKQGAGGWDDTLWVYTQQHPLTLKEIRNRRLTDVPLWQTPLPVTLGTDWDASYIRIDIHHAAITEWVEQVRFWRIAYLTVSAQFLVVTVAAVWGWTR